MKVVECGCHIPFFTNNEERLPSCASCNKPLCANCLAANEAAQEEKPDDPYLCTSCYESTSAGAK